MLPDWVFEQNSIQRKHCRFGNLFPKTAHRGDQTYVPFMLKHQEGVAFYEKTDFPVHGSGVGQGKGRMGET